MITVQHFIEAIERYRLFLKTDTLLLAVSGGVDSASLCELCRQAGYTFQIAHANFQLRGEESQRDELFVRKLGQTYDCDVIIKRFDAAAYAEQHRLSIQVAARQLRYDWFDELLTQPASNGLLLFKGVVTAHHADDNIETLLINFFRGTGISGLRGMLPRQGKILRPLLNFRRDEIIAFAQSNGLQWVEDSSNASDKYTRNYFRNAIIPLVNKIFPEAENNLLDNIDRFRDLEIIYKTAMTRQVGKLVRIKGQEAYIPVLALRQAEALHSVIYELIRPYHFTAQQVKEVAHLLYADQGKYVRSSTHRIIRNRNWLIVAALHPAESAHIVIERGKPSVVFEKGELTLQDVDGPQVITDADNCIALLDAKLIRFPLTLRKWKPGDYFYPLGMRKKKKVSRFLIDQKLSPTEKERVWLIESEGKVLWIVGMRIDDRFKLSEKTKSGLTLTLHTNQ